MDTDSQGMLKLAISEELDGLFLLQKAGLKQQIGFHDSVFWKTIEISHMDDGKVFLKWRTKPSLGKPALEGHLTALKTCFGPSPRTRILPFGSPAGRLAMSGSNPSAHSLSFFSCSFRRFQFI
jgi:hypothetical protein